MNPPSPDKQGIAAALLLVAGLVVAESHAQEGEILGFELEPEELAASSASLTAALVGPRERALGQVLTDARIEWDQTLQGEISYDLIVQYDPGRYRDAHAGLYPMTFENQFILWGKRIALFTRSNRWRAGRFYLHDISSGDQAWMFANETRNLYPPPAMKITYPAVVDADNTAGLRPWLKLIHQVEWGTDLRRMSRWFRLMRSETRDDVQRKAIEEQQKAAAMEVQTP
jgi:hypothetical protein